MQYMPRLSDSGAFTPGGTKDVCGHQTAMDYFTDGMKVEELFHWKHRVVNCHEEPPPQCLLRHGKKL